jgi:hypothetical protein
MESLWICCGTVMDFIGKSATVPQQIHKRVLRKSNGKYSGSFPIILPYSSHIAFGILLGLF